MKPGFFNKIICRLFPSPVETDLTSYENILQKINSLGNKYSGMADNDLKNEADRFRSQVSADTDLNMILPGFFALVREVCQRQIGLRPFNVQVLAAIVLHSGNLVEMATGEGKTLAAILPACLNGLTGNGVHILTFNDYLAERDSEWMGPVYRFLGLTVGCVKEDMDSRARKKAWSADITYATAKQAGFDYLRDCASARASDMVHRPFHYVIIDEADALLVDEARNPLVLAEQVHGKVPDRARIAKFVSSLREDGDYLQGETGLSVSLSDQGIVKAEKEFGITNLHAEENYGLLTAINCGLHASVLLQKDRDYIVRDGRILIVDEFTGRIVEDRQWQNGLQTAVEAREGLRSQSEGRIIGSLAPQFYFRMYPKIAAMTGTARPSADEIKSVYGLKTVVIPTHKVCVRNDQPDLVFPDISSKIQAVIDEVRKLNHEGRPVLIGTRTVSESEELSSAIKSAGIECVVLNAKNDRLEAGIIAEAGRLGAVTISTNMAGRGTDIILGGRNSREKDEVTRLGGLYVMGTNRHESRRIDDQLRGRAGRQGDPGSTQFMISLKDDLWIRHGLQGDLSEGLKRSKSSQDSRMTKAVNHAQRVLEGRSREMRRTLFDYSSFLEKQRLIFLGLKRDVLEKTVDERREFVCEKLNGLWSDHLAFSMDLREGIHLLRIGGEDPLKVWQNKLDREFQVILQGIEKIRAIPEDPDEGRSQQVAPGSTWTYILNDDPFDGRMALLDNSKMGFQIDVPSMLLLTAARKAKKRL
jgi:preprotein translocase subunit SecA